GTTCVRPAGALRDLPPLPTRRSSDLHGRPARLNPFDKETDMARAQGARARMALAFETTYGTPPGSGYTRMPFASATLGAEQPLLDRKSTRLNSSHVKISYAVFCLKKK